MLVTITEKYQNGAYTKAAHTSLNGKECLLAVVMCQGSKFARRLKQFEEGYFHSSVVEVPKDFYKKGSIKLTLPAIAE